MNPELIQKTQEFLFADIEEMTAARIPQPMQERIFRLRSMYTYWVGKPSLADKATMSAYGRHTTMCV